MPRIHHRIDQIVPSSNTTMETETPAMLRAREGLLPQRFTFHSARRRMKHVTKEALVKMDADSDRCALESSDARVDVLGYASLAAIMSMGRGYHRVSEARLCARTLENEGAAPVVTSAGALVVDCIEHEGIEVLDALSLEIGNNLEVGARDPRAPIDLSHKLNTAHCDAVVISACAQMPSLASVQPVENRLGLPLVSASICTTWRMLKALNLQASAPSAGSLLSGRY